MPVKLPVDLSRLFSSVSVTIVRNFADGIPGKCAWAALITVSKKMLADLTKTVAANPKSGENPYAKKMRLHSESETW